MIWVVGLFWVVSLVLLLLPFVAKKTGLETLDALDIFAIRQGILLCWLIFSLYPVWLTGFVALVALLPRATFKRSLILVCLSIVGMALSFYI